ncbi:MAG: hypothetical protein AB8B51_04165 [Sedimentitalea sp.]
MTGKGKKGRWTRLEIEWGQDLAKAIGTDPSFDADDAPEVDFDDEVAGILEKYWLGPFAGAFNLALLAPGSHPNDFDKILKDVDQLRDDIGKMSNHSMQQALNGALPIDFDAQVSDVVVRVGERTAKAESLRAKLLERAAPEDANPEQPKLSEARDKGINALSNVPLSNGHLELAEAALVALDTEIKSIRAALDVLKLAMADIKNRRDLVTERGYLKDQIDDLTEAQDKLAAFFKPPIYEAQPDAALKALEALEDLAKTVAADIAGYGDVAGIDAMCVTFGVKPDTFADIEAKFGSRKDMIALATAFPGGKLKDIQAGFGTDGLVAAVAAFGTADALAKAAAAFGSGDDLAKAATAFGSAAVLAKATQDFGSADAFAKAATAVGGMKSMVGLCTKGGMDAGKAKTLIDNMGAPLVGAVMAGGDDPAKMIALSDAFKGDFAAFKAMSKDAGFAGKPKALAAVFTKGCAGKPADFVTFCTDMDTPEAHKDLADLLGAGGLGDAPDAFGALIAGGCGGAADGLKKIGVAFKSKEAKDGLKDLLSKGGLAGQKGGDGDINDTTLSMLFEHGAGPMPGGQDAATYRATALAELAKNIGEDGCKRLKTTLAKGGLGADPEVFGHLVGVGCKGDPATKLNALTTELAKGTNQKKLKDMLQDGGFGSTDAGGVATNTKTNCLGKLLDTGCDGKPAELTKLLSALGPGDMTNMKGLMTTGDLGKHPDVLANMYKHGCITAPGGADDGIKNPTVLKTMMTSFNSGGGTPAQFQDLLVNGGFTAVGKEERLGSVMRYAFTPKAPNSPQNGNGLKQMQGSFSGHMGDLATMMNAMETASPDVLEPRAIGSGNQPGKGLQNIVTSPRQNNSAANLYAQVYLPLKQCATASGGAGNHMNCDQLLQTAASFEHSTAPTPDVNVGGGANRKTLRMDHVVERHTREHGILSNAPGGASSCTTLYPKGITQTEIARMVGEAITNVNPNTPHANQPNRHGGAAKRNPPRDRHDLMYTPPSHHPYRPANYFSKYRGVTDASGYTNRIGYARKGGTNDVKITQFFPEGPFPPLVKVTNRDMTALRTALR